MNSRNLFYIRYLQLRYNESKKPLTQALFFLEKSLFDFAKNVELLILREYWGLYNMVCKGITSRYEVAEYIYFLCSEKNTLITNQNINISGGE